MSKKALVSVSDKTGLELLLASLCDQDYQIISTGGTAKYIREAGF
jgi:phosphoribosylaminoimidazolecarboxamide formyltransferase / IMP cyclohydrolase